MSSNFVKQNRVAELQSFCHDSFSNKEQTGSLTESSSENKFAYMMEKNTVSAKYIIFIAAGV